MTSTHIKSEVVKAQTWEDLRGLGDFDVLRPAYLPDGLTLEGLAFGYFPFEGASFPLHRNGIVAAYWSSPDGFLLFEQGWGMGWPTMPIPNDVPHAVVRAGSYEATWTRGPQPGGVGPPTERKPDDAYMRLGWLPDSRGMTGPGWKLSTDFLSLDDLVKIAASFS